MRFPRKWVAAKAGKVLALSLSWKLFSTRHLKRELRRIVNGKLLTRFGMWDCNSFDFIVFDFRLNKVIWANDSLLLVILSQQINDLIVWVAQAIRCCDRLIQALRGGRCLTNRVDYFCYIRCCVSAKTIGKEIDSIEVVHPWHDSIPHSGSQTRGRIALQTFNYNFSRLEQVFLARQTFD